MELALPWFVERKGKLSGNPHLVAVLIRNPGAGTLATAPDPTNTHPIVVVQAIFNKDSKELDEHRVGRCKRLAPDLERQFGHREMLILD